LASYSSSFTRQGLHFGSVASKIAVPQRTPIEAVAQSLQSLLLLSPFGGVREGLIACVVDFSMTSVWGYEDVKGVGYTFRPVG
jgi:hypothetical protein